MFLHWDDQTACTRPFCAACVREPSHKHTHRHNEMKINKKKSSSLHLYGLHTAQRQQFISSESFHWHQQLLSFYNSAKRITQTHNRFAYQVYPLALRRNKFCPFEFCVHQTCLLKYNAYAFNSELYYVQYFIPFWFGSTGFLFYVFSLQNNLLCLLYTVRQSHWFSLRICTIFNVMHQQLNSSKLIFLNSVLI